MDKFMLFDIKNILVIIYFPKLQYLTVHHIYLSLIHRPQLQHRNDL